MNKVKWCCNGLEHAIIEKTVVVDNDHVTSIRAFPDIRIFFCPFCGTKIHYEEVKDEVDFTVKEDFFTHQSLVHGVLHTYRVMHNVIAVGTLHYYTQEEINVALCAAFIHDLAREHDGLCYEHGKWAIEKKLPEHIDKFLAFGLTADNLEELKTAVENHAQPFEIDKDHPHYRITALLKDADALDRIRLGEDNLDIRYLRLEHSKICVYSAKMLFYKTDFYFENLPTWKEFCKYIEHCM